MEFQDAKRALKAVCGHSDSESSDNECRKTLHVMFGGSWAITSRRVIKTLRRVVAHYRYLVLKMSSLKGVLKIRGGGGMTRGFLRWRSSRP
jgi:hypothetical protein